ncbi:metallophosphoesterase family protein [Microlunatus parietis]|uniref:Calcineurin-like phosphoesterase domain-containing protein n=1 Tax=Microlunatus parietis TaxID=682979 RepID=A0A7Y9I4M9_9ACTN|nr:metallophosphoesterase family protein [Microlunatus parietis]NYE69724.1 hypothetical protein [Microlunatus parietis]
MTDHDQHLLGTDEPSPGIDRRRFIGIGGAAAAVGLGAAAVNGFPAQAKPRGNRQLSFGNDGTFTIVQFNDTQDDEQIDRRTIELMEKTLDSVRPDLVIMNGDNITGGCENALAMRQAMNNVVLPMEDRKIPWAVTFGNHDEDSTPDTGLDEPDMLAFYRSYAHNLNRPGPDDVTGTGNMNLIINGSKDRRPAFNLFLLDSGRYAPEKIAGQDFEGYPTWDWLRMNQVHWYTETSRRVERQARRLVPGLMFIHIPLWEYRFMWWGSVDGRSAADHERAVARHKIVGERNEDECPGPINSGMFSAILDRGDVKGVFCGHDHVNTYVGDYYGVLLGYAGNTGFGTYGLSGAERNRLRGARVFTLTEQHDDIEIDTHMVWAKDFGIDLTANDQPIPPAPLDPSRR